MAQLLILPTDPETRRAAMRKELSAVTRHASPERRRAHAIEAMIYALELYRDLGITPPWAQPPAAA